MKKLTTVCLMIPSVFLLIHSSGVSAQVGIEANGVYGGSVSLNESIPFTNPSISWSFNQTVVVAVRAVDREPECVGTYKGRCTLLINGTLILDSLTNTDDGIYTMTAQPPDLTAIRTSTYQLKVYPPLSAPVLSSNSTNNNKLVSGTYVSLHCDGGNQSITRYIFFRDGKDVCSGRNVACSDSYLHFQPITVSDSGNYTCVIQNPVTSNTSNTLQLAVSAPVSDVRLTSNASGYLWPGINSTSLTCSALGTDVSYTWSLKGVPLPQNLRYQLTQGNSVLTISPVSDNDDGPFTCTASNWINNMPSNNLTFNLAANVSNVSLTSNSSGESRIWAEEDSVYLHCSADGTEVHFSWALNGKPLSNDPHYHITTSVSPPSSDLTISPISKNDTGSFTCEASNLISKENKSVTFNLGWRPEGNISCSAEASGTDVNLMCSWLGGNPAANVSLIFNNQTMTEHNNVTRSVSTSSSIQGSNLTCQGDQLGKTSQCTVELERPKAPGHDNNSVTKGIAGHTVVLTLTLKEGLPCVFNWARLTPNPGPIQNPSARATITKYDIISTSLSSSLHILDATVNDSGKYECTAKNIIGAENFIFNVNVTAQGGGNDESPKPKTLGGGAIAGIVIGVLAGIALIGILAFFLVRKNKRSKERERINEPGDQLGAAENQNAQDDVKYAVINFAKNNSSAKASNPAPEETEYSTVKTSAKR
ncbi:carcinoembryonic antigen-related cell adhesion molecule 1-like isoform X1 [Hyperolius riggenbachi]|uniref:carcinoembryonic antigen-related cell adhesion molecule 1-like isoform X1 n=1 Tax=Hyperolius riggenbachi TaxID=752182 RepID=UPI0035A2F180